MGFKFRLERLLDYKETVEGLKKTEYGQKVYQLSKEEEKLKKINNKKYEIIQSKNSEGKVFNIATLRSYNNYINQLEKDIEVQEVNVEKSKKNMEKAQRELLKAVQEKKAFEKLKENDFEEYMEEEKKKEAKVIDEIVTFKTNAQ